MDCLKSYCEKIGIPLSLYTDRGSHFTANLPKNRNETVNSKEEVETQFQRALRELNIEQILARSAQGKGRVERCFKTMQDRLVNVLRINNIKSIEDAKIFLEDTFLPRFNKRFTVKPKSELNAHRPSEGFDLDAIFSIQSRRKVMNDNTFRFNAKRYQIDLKPNEASLKKKWVTVEQRLNGRLAVRHGKNYYKFHLFIQ
jgi:transposase InsO family protein